MSRTLAEAEKTITRGGNFLFKLFDAYKVIGISQISAKDCMRLLNTYGLSDGDIYILTFSHGCTCDWEGFEKLKLEDNRRMSQICPKKENT